MLEKDVWAGSYFSRAFAVWCFPSQRSHVSYWTHVIKHRKRSIRNSGNLKPENHTLDAVIPDYSPASEPIWCIWDKRGLNIVNSSCYICLGFISKAKKSVRVGLFRLICLYVAHLHSTQLFQRYLAPLLQTSHPEPFCGCREVMGKDRGKHWWNTRIISTNNIFWAFGKTGCAN